MEGFGGVDPGGSVMEAFIDLIRPAIDLVARLPIYVAEQDRWALILITIVATAGGVGAVTRNEELGVMGKVIVCSLLFCMLFGLGLLLTYFTPVFFDMANLARSQSSR